ncbi:MAG: PAS domain S-box protein, partial [Planctomycetales bacterium]|nr:PAS domain S-box protein [Planctomycetales bacterium]
VDMGVESYLGAPLIDSHGAALGILAVLDDRPMQRHEEIASLLEIFAAQAATELERSRAEEALRNSEQQLQQTLERLERIVAGTSDGLWDWDIAANRVWFSPRGMELLGHGAKECTKDTAFWAEVIHPDDLERVESAMLRHFAEGAAYDVEFRMQTVDGQYRWFRSRANAVRDDAGAPVRMAGSIRDVTDVKRMIDELKQARAESLQARDQLAEAIESISEGFALYDAADRLVMCNGRYREVYDISGDLLVPGAKFEDHIRLAAYRGQEAAAVGREEQWVRERVEQHQNPQGVYMQQLGNGRWLQISERKTKEGGVVGVRTDVTERKLAEDSLRESERRFSLFMKHLPGLAWIKDLQGRYVFVNEAAEEAFGVPRSKIYGRTDDDIFPPEVAAQFKENDRRALTSAAGVEAVETLLQSDGRVHHSLVSKFALASPEGRPLLIGGVAVDITRRMQAEHTARNVSDFR